MTLTPPLPATVPAAVLEQIPQQQDLGKFVVLGFSKGDTLTHFLAFETERQRNEFAARINKNPGSHVRLFNPSKGAV
jgi:hypothetical protein